MDRTKLTKVLQWRYNTSVRKDMNVIKPLLGGDMTHCLRTPGGKGKLFRAIGILGMMSLYKKYTCKMASMGNLAIHKIAVMGELLTGKKWSAKENLPSYKMGAMMNLAITRHLSDKCISTPARCSELPQQILSCVQEHSFK